MIKKLLIVILFSLNLFGFSIASYNVENLFDGKDDGSEYKDFNIKKDGWDSAKAQKKYNNIKKVIKAINADVVALQEVENIDLMNRLAKDLGYLHVHFSKPSWSAVGVGVLSKIKSKTIQKIEVPKSRDMLHVEVEDINLIVVHWPARELKRAERVNALKLLKSYTNGLKNLVLVGDFNEPLSNGSIFEDEYLHVRKIGWFDLWYLQKDRWNYIYGGKKTVLDRVIVSEDLLGSTGYNVSSFEVFRRDFFTDKNGYPKRSTKSGDGYSDHLPLLVKLEKKPFSLDVKNGNFEDIKEGVKLQNVSVIHSTKSGFVLAQEGRGVYVYNAGFMPAIGLVLDVVVHGIGSFGGVKQITALHVEKIHPKKIDPTTQMRSSIKDVKAGDVIKSVEGEVKDGYMNTKDGKIKLYAKGKKIKDGYAKFEAVRVGSYSGKIELMIGEK